MGIFLADEQTFAVDNAGLRHLAELVVKSEGYPSETEVTILLVEEREMSAYNQKFLHRDGPTDVLAFPVEETRAGTVPEFDADGPPLILGDVIIAPTFVQNQALNLEVEFDDEMALMVCHGVLHLMGYDHQADNDAEVMERREAELLAMVGRRRR